MCQQLKSTTIEDTLIKRMLPAMNSDHGDRMRAWDEFWAIYGDALTRYIHWKGGKDLKSEEVAQNVFADAFGNIEVGEFEYRGVGPFIAYFKRIAENKIIEAWNRQVPLELSDNVTDDNPGRPVERIVEERELRKVLFACIEQLPPYSRTVMKALMEGEQPEHTMEEHQLSSIAYRVAKHKGIQRLRTVANYLTMYI